MGYSIEIFDVNAEDQQEWVTVTPSQGAQGCVHTVLDLEDTEYIIRLSAINAAGVGQPLQLSESCRPIDIKISPEIEMDSEVGQFVTVQAGTQIKLLGSLYGRPAPTVKWERESGDINSMAVIESTNDATCLVVNEATRDDAGT